MTASGEHGRTSNQSELTLGISSICLRLQLVIQSHVLYPVGRAARCAPRLDTPPGLFQLIRIFADLDSGFFSTVTSSTPSL